MLKTEIRERVAMMDVATTSSIREKPLLIVS